MSSRIGLSQNNLHNLPVVKSKNAGLHNAHACMSFTAEVVSPNLTTFSAGRAGIPCVASGSKTENKY